MSATAEQVKAIFDTDLTEAEVGPFLTTAIVMVAEVCADAGYSATLLVEIEKWLAAHLLTARDPRTASQTAGDADVTYESAVRVGLESSKYGQQVMLLDYKGCFAEVNAAKRAATIEVLG